MRKLNERIDLPELGADVEGLEGVMVRVPRVTDFRKDPEECIRERRAIIEWCSDQGIKLAMIDMARKKSAATSFALPTLSEQEWEVFIEGDETHAVIFKLRWS